MSLAFWKKEKESILKYRKFSGQLDVIKLTRKYSIETNKQDVLKELRKTTVKDGKGKGDYDTDTDTKFVSLKELATLSEIRTEDDIEKLIDNIRDGLVRLLSEYRKIVIL